MAKRRSYKRDKRGRFSETLGGLASKAKARANNSSLGKAVRGKGRKQGGQLRQSKLLARKIGIIEQRRDSHLAFLDGKTKNQPTRRDGRPLAASTLKRERAETANSYNTQISNLKNYGRSRPTKRRKARVDKRRAKGQYGTRV